MQNADTLMKNDTGNDKTNEGNVENADTRFKDIGFSIEFQVPCGQRELIYIRTARGSC